MYSTLFCLYKYQKFILISRVISQIILNINKMIYGCPTCHQQDEIKANIINLIHEYTKTGRPNYLYGSGSEYEGKYNYIISKLEQLKTNKQNNNFQGSFTYKLLTASKWTKQQEANVYRFFNLKQSNVVNHRMRIIHQTEKVLNQVTAALTKYNSSINFGRFTSISTVKDQVDSLIKKIKLYQKAIKVVAQYPSKVNMDKIREFINQKTNQLGQIQSKDFNNILCVKGLVINLEQKLQPYRLIRQNGGSFDEHLSNKILMPCQNLIKTHIQAYQSLNQFCFFNTKQPINSVNCSKRSVKSMIDLIIQEQKNAKKSIEIMSQKINKILQESHFPYTIYKSISTLSRSIEVMSQKIDSIQEMINYYLIFGDRIQFIRVQTNKRNIHNAAIQWLNKYSNQNLTTHQNVCKIKLENNLKFLKHLTKIDVQVQINEHRQQNTKRLIVEEEQIETEASNQTQSQSFNKTQTQLYLQNTTFIKRWQTVWLQLGLNKIKGINIDYLKIPAKGQKDEQLLAVCNQIQHLSKYKQLLTDIIGNDDVNIFNQLRDLIVKNMQFLRSNEDISYQFYKDKQKINNLVLSEYNLRQQINQKDDVYNQLNRQFQNLNRQLQYLKGYLMRFLEKVQQIKTIFNITFTLQINRSRYQQIIQAMNFLIQRNAQSDQICKKIQADNIKIKQEQQIMKIKLDEIIISNSILENEKSKVTKALQRRQQQLKLLQSINKQQISKRTLLETAFKKLKQQIQQEHNTIIKQLDQVKRTKESNAIKISELNSQIQEKNQSLIQLRSLQEANQQQIKRKYDELSKANYQIKSLKHQVEAIRFEYLFNIKGQIYQIHQVTQTLFKQINHQSGKNIKSATNLLFLDKMMLISKPKIDIKGLCNHQYNLIVIKTTNKIIACFISTPLSLTSQKIIHKHVEKSFLLVGNESNCQIYYLKDSNKLNFDINSLLSYIIIGKSDLRIDIIEGKITSNMGQSEAQFDSKGKKGRDIFGGDNIPFESLEIYKVQFQEKKNQQYSVKCKTYSQIGEKKNTYSTLQITNQVEQYKNQVEADYTRQVQPQFQQNNQDLFESAYQEVRQNYQLIAKSFQSNIYSHIARYLQPKINLQAIEKRVAELKDRKKEGEQHIKLLSESLNQYKQRCFNLQKNIDELKISNQRYRQNQQSSQNMIQSYKKQLQNLNTLVRKQKLQISNLSLQLQTTKNDLNNQQLQLENIKLKMQMMQQEKNQSNQTDQKQLQNQKRKIQESKRKQKDLQANKQRQINWLKEQLRQLRDKVDRLQNDYTNATKQIKQKNLIISESKKQIENINKTMKNNEYKKAPETSLRQKLQKQISSKQLSQFEAHKKKLIKLYTQRCSNYPPEIKAANLNQIFLTFIERFFQGDLLQDQIILKYHLMSHIQKLTGTQILRTKLIYNFDLRNKANFHVYIDKVQSLLCIIKLKSGVFLAGYYTGEYLQGPMTQPGLLINLTKNESYYLNVAQNSSKSSYRAMVYDSYFIIFGNAQIRIKTGQNILFSNFGIANSYFNANNKKLVDFIGENKREVQLESYEIYQVLFNNTFDRNE